MRPRTKSHSVDLLHVGSFRHYAAWILALLLVAGTFAAGHSQAQDRPPSDDASITRRVEGVLAKDPSLRTQEIYVETRDGVVNLSGFVRSLDDAAKAGELAGGVRGVTAVRNSLRVANRPSRA